MSELDTMINDLHHQDEEKYASDKAKKIGLPFVSLVGYPFAPDIIGIVPQDQAATHRVVSFARIGDRVKVATDEPAAEDLKSFLETMTASTNLTFELFYCSKTSLDYALNLALVLNPKVDDKSVQVTAEAEKKFEEEIQTLQGLKNKISSVSVTELLDVVFAGAMKLGASDIHIEPGETDFRVRFRIDGVLSEIAGLPMSSFHNVISRIKYMAKLKLDLTHPQDGRFALKVLGHDVDVRVATAPTTYGEAVVMRLLPKDKDFITLENLGFSKQAMDAISEAITKPQGMIINTGPTGSGKTTTLYAILKKLNEPGRKIITMEDPIEYRMAGIEQIQISHEEARRDLSDREGWNQTSENQRLVSRAETDFLNILKSTLRQDPDILMVGEIRDKETANIALQAAMTGHLVLTTLHTLNAPSALARLTEMGVEPYLLSGTINLIIGQRLVRKICKTCQGKGCDECHNTGFKGRMAIIEVLKPTAEIEKLITEKAPLRTFEEAAHKLGMETMYEDGMRKVEQGLTTKEEVERVTKE